MFCGKCGTQLSDTDKFCPRCGEKVIPVIVEEEKPSVNQEEVQKPEIPASLEQSKPMKDSNETVRPKIVPLQNVSDKQNNTNGNENTEVGGTSTYDIQKISIVSSFLFALIIPILFVKGFWSNLILCALVPGLIKVVSENYNIKISNRIFYSIIAVVALTGTVKSINTNSDSSEGGFSIFGGSKNSISDIKGTYIFKHHKEGYDTRTYDTGSRLLNEYYKYKKKEYRIEDYYEYIVVMADGRVTRHVSSYKKEYIGNVTEVNNGVFMIRHTGRTSIAGLEYDYMSKYFVFDTNEHKVYNNLSTYKNRDIENAKCAEYESYSEEELENNTEYQIERQ